MQKIGLTLGGGGARGLCHIKFLEVLEAMELKPAIISGTSIGAIVGAFVACGFKSDDIKKLLDQLGLLEIKEAKKTENPKNKIGNFFKEKIKDLKEVYEKVENVPKIFDLTFFSNISTIKGKKIEKFFQKNLPAKTFEELDIPLKIVATNYWEQKQVVFDSGDLIPAIRASMSIPGVFHPVTIDDEIYIDGGITNNLPFDIIRDDCDLLIAIDVSGKEVKPENNKNCIPNWFDNIMTSFEILQASIIRYQLEINKPDIYMKPGLLNIKILDFHKTRQILNSVENDVKNFKELLTKKIK